MYHKKHRLLNRIIASVLLFAITATFIPLSDHHAHTAEAAISSRTCPRNGSPKPIGRAGCRFCGGTGREYYTEAPSKSVDSNYGKGKGYNTKTDTNGNSKTITYYRCYNCGDTGYDCKQYDEIIEIEYCYQSCGKTTIIL